VAPVAGVTLAEKQAVNAALRANGAPIAQMNTLCKHLSRVKGGQLAAAAFPLRMLTLMISDVPGDDPAFIGSGPTVGNTSTAAQAQEIVRRWRLDLGPCIGRALAAGSSVCRSDDPRLARVTNRIYAAPGQSLAAAAALAAALGCETRILGDAVEGEAREVAAHHAALALELRATRPAGAAPLVLL
jgi:glycerate 2-kinase